MKSSNNTRGSLEKDTTNFQPSLYRGHTLTGDSLHLRVYQSWVALFIPIHDGCQLCQWFSVLCFKEYPHLLPCILAYLIVSLRI